MKEKQVFRRALALVLAVLMLLSAVSCGKDEDKEDDNDRRSARATSMHLRKTEGSVSVEDDEGKDLKPQKDMGLYDGYQVGTERDSFAWIDLDKTKLVKLDERSRVEIQRKKDDLELTVSKGSLFFNITKPLDEDESLNISTSTMVVGIRGTCGWVQVESKQELNVYILEGTVECTVTSKDGKVISTSVTAGEKARITREDEAADIRVERVSQDELPEFVLEELEDNNDLCQAIQEASGLDLGAAGESGFRMEDLARVSYTGDLSRCAMTPEQAKAFAQVLEECLEELPGSSDWSTPFLRTALFDAGDGLPVLWVVMGDHIYVNSEYGYIPAENRFYQWDGRNAVRVLETERSDYWLVDEGLVLTNRYPYDRTGLYPLSRGRISEEPEHIYELFELMQPTRPTSDEWRNYITSVTGDQSYNFRTAPDYTIYQPDYGDDAWFVAALDGRFREPADTRNMSWATASCILGHGQGAHQDVDWDWYGTWTDGADMLAALTGGASGQAPASPARYRTTTTYDPSTYIRHTDLDVGGMDLELYFEIPVFPEDSKGYRSINHFFQTLEDLFFAEDGEATGMVELRQEFDLNETYASTYDAFIHTHSDELVSVSLYNYYYGGGTHPNSFQESYNFRTDNGEPVLLRDLIDGTDDEIRTMIADALDPEYQLTPEERASIMSYDVDNFNFYVKDGSVWVYFNPYDISYYARGSFLAQLDVPLKHLS